ncbi:recombination activating gene 1 activating protein 1 isoform X1 [Nasonia vitripennis]|uniref:Sugar transporter SWEET1 n=1 Tax=Nasonia vitripennis TaxID=7425 RepID=A0A7M7QH62_NASVI|nr:recombination activating gene 1 activating protein 1 isoform X1 [Nasonia vitripennis]XP_031787500.1 recombination activating gene 1 activating protein 1 isoform X1 [Nasonia vitripennis]XP_031787501.1 recombination activating gene 1 activating protein 1 isoform X1 [Nasonia vitripennis]
MNLEAFRDILASTASICTILQFLSGTLVCMKFAKNKSTGDASGMTFVTCFMSCSLWLLYGILIQDKSVMIVNIIGSSLQFLYAFAFYIYTIHKKIIVKQMFLAMTFIGFMYLYWIAAEDQDLVTKRVGFISCALTILFFASPMTLLAHVIRVKSAESLPFPVIMASFITSCQWFLYGCLIDDLFIQTPNLLGCVLSAFQLALFIVFPNRKANDQELLI